MNFFESQDLAKRNTGRLIVLFSLAVLSLIVITNLLVMVAFGLIPTEGLNSSTFLDKFNFQTFAAVSLGVLAVILFGSLYKLMSLAGGGARVAEMLNGRLLMQETDDFHERQVLNVVEEMALASGTPVPPVYLMEEQGINAFAAGYAPGDAVIGITRGAIDSLTRDELQGVIAHEFSHILHGDMRINIRLIAILHGILILGILGYHLMRGGVYSRRSKESGGIVALGLGLLVIGYVGTFFGNLIKAAVSRQREYLADASAVQYTRNPQGIGGALMRIATHDGRSYLNNPSSMEISHALFEEGMVSRLRSLYATHPPLEKRITAILPNWDGSYDMARQEKAEKAAADEQSAQVTKAGDRREQLLTGITGILVANAMLDQIGQPGAGQIDAARRILAALPQHLVQAAHDPSAARAVIYLLVLDTDVAIRKAQLEFLERSADKGVSAELARLTAKTQQIDPEHRLPLLSIALNSLRQLSVPQFRLFKANLNQLIKMDEKVSLFEWSLQKQVINILDPVFEKQGPRPLGRKSLSECRDSLEVLLSVLALSDRESKVTPEEAFAKANEKLEGIALGMRPRDKLSFEALNEALDDLVELKPLQKPALLKACAATILADNRVAPIEVELLRAIGAALDCPIPPLVIESQSS